MLDQSFENELIRLEDLYDEKLYFSEGKLLGVELNKKKVFEVNLKTGSLKAFFRLK